MTLTERVRERMPRNGGLRRISLQTKLVASVLVLVFAALTLISAASTYFLNSYLINRLDAQLWEMADSAPSLKDVNYQAVYAPSEYIIAFTTVDGGGKVFRDLHLTNADLPLLLKGNDAIAAQERKPYTVRGQNGGYMWRMLVIRLPDDTIMHVGQRMRGVDDVIARLVLVDVLVGVGVLICLALVGAALVRQSLIPLRQVERTAAAIAAGDQTRRVPDPEEAGGHPTPQLGR
ncbi:two-component sensor histidine kinase, partial [Actinoplanes philippinensis]